MFIISVAGRSIYVPQSNSYFVDDALTCCCCNIKLLYSDSENDMWQRHVLFSPDCILLREEKGEDFVKAEQEKWKKVFF